MSLHTLTSLVNEGLVKNINKLEEKYFLQEELPAYKFIEKYLHKYNQLPKLETCRQEGFALPEAHESFEYYLEGIRARYVRVMLNNAFAPENIAQLLAKNPQETAEVLEIMKSDIESVYRSKELTDIFEGADDVYKFMHEAMAGGVMGISSGSAILDSLTHGFKPADFIVLFARPGVGKTFLLLAFARAVLDQGKIGLFINNEMSDLEIQQRFWASVMGLNTNLMYEGEIQTPHFEKLKKKKEDLKRLGSNLHVFNPSKRLNIIRLKSLILEVQPDVIFIDSAYLLAPDPSTVKSSSGSLDRLNSVVEDLRNLAKHLNIPIIAVAQANRASVGKKTTDTTAIAGSDYWSQMASVMLHLDEHATDDKFLIGTLVKNRGGKCKEDGESIQFMIDNDFDHMKFGINRRIGKADKEDQEDEEGNMKWD